MFKLFKEKEHIDSIEFLKRHPYLNLEITIYDNIINLNKEQIKTLCDDFFAMYRDYIDNGLRLWHKGAYNILKSIKKKEYWLISVRLLNGNNLYLDMKEMPLGKIIRFLDNQKYLLINEDKSDEEKIQLEANEVTLETIKEMEEIKSQFIDESEDELNGSNNKDLSYGK